MKKKLKLFADAHVLDGEFQGTRTFVRELYKVLCTSDDLEIYLGAHDTANLAETFNQTPGVKFIQYSSKSKFRRLLVDIPRAIDRYGIDYAHFQYITPIVKRCRFIVTIHDVIFTEFHENYDLLFRHYKRALFRLGICMSDILTTVSEYSRISIQNNLKLRERKIHVIPNGVNPVFFEPFNKRLAEEAVIKKYGIGKFILYVSRFEPRKNHHLLLDTFVNLELHKAGFCLVLLGSRSMPTPLFDQALRRLDASIKSHVLVRSNISDAELIEFYRAATVFVYPSKAEGFGIPPLEAGASRVPVLCSSTTAMGEYGFFSPNFFDPYEKDSFRKKLWDLCSAPGTDMPLEEVARTIRHNYSWEESAEKFHQILREHRRAMAKT